MFDGAVCCSDTIHLKRIMVCALVKRIHLHSNDTTNTIIIPSYFLLRIAIIYYSIALRSKQKWKLWLFSLLCVGRQRWHLLRCSTNIRKVKEFCVFVVCRTPWKRSNHQYSIIAFSSRQFILVVCARQSHRSQLILILLGVFFLPARKCSSEWNAQWIQNERKEVSFCHLTIKFRRNKIRIESKLHFFFQTRKGGNETDQQKIVTKVNFGLCRVYECVFHVYLCVGVHFECCAVPHSKLKPVFYFVRSFVSFVSLAYSFVSFIVALYSTNIAILCRFFE